MVRRRPLPLLASLGFAIACGGSAGSRREAPDDGHAARGACGDGSSRRAATEDRRLTARIVRSSPLDGVRAGSGLARAGDRLLVAQDDVPSVALVDPATLASEKVILDGDGSPLAKAEKHDFEAVLEDASGTFHVLGSGSTPRRRRIARIATAHAVDLVDAAPLYDSVASALGETPNLEGALLIRGRLRLFHRGAGGSPSATIDVDRSALDGGPAGVAARCQFDLGTAGGVPLTFTDATPVDGGARIVYLAVAEDTANAIDDGAIVGAAVGILTDDGVRYARLVESDGTPSVRKVEGIVLDDDGRAGWLVTDADDPARPAELCRLELTGPW